MRSSESLVFIRNRYGPRIRFKGRTCGLGRGWKTLSLSFQCSRSKLTTSMYVHLIKEILCLISCVQHRERMKKMCFFNPQRKMKMHAILNAKPSSERVKSPSGLLLDVNDCHAFGTSINPEDALNKLEVEEKVRLARMSKTRQWDHTTVRSARIINGSTFLLKSTWKGFDSPVTLTLLQVGIHGYSQYKAKIPRSLLHSLHRRLVSEKVRKIQPVRLQRVIVRTSILQAILACIRIDARGHIFVENYMLGLE